MAVKVMVAPAIAKGAQKLAVERKPRAPAEAPKPKRRRSSIYDADGNEVFITLMCLKCHKMRPLSQFGLRKMADGAIRNQPWCRTCRSAAGTKGKGRGAAETVDSPVAEAPLEAMAEPAVAEAAAATPAATGGPAAPEPRAGGNLSAQIAAALAAGLGR
ncbi:MAG TPA: hypothetical protein VFM45_01015 [Anaeromyxobacteraceae bacterium]|nr:hypothetical protein [Anaeromyxobacteraceae bacterium]